MKHAYILHSSLNGGTESKFEFQPHIERRTLIKLSRDMLTAAEIAQLPSPLEMAVTAPFDGGDIPEVFGSRSRNLFVTAKMRNYIQQLEPGVHHFLPFQLHSTVLINGKTDHGEHFILLPPPLIDCLVIEETDFWKGYGLAGWEQGEDGIGGGGLSPTPNEKCTLKKSAVEGRHLWRTKVGDSYDFTCSDEFWEGIKTQLQIWAPHTQCTLK